MVAYLKGVVRAKGKSWLIVDTGVVGYKVFCSPLLWAEVREGDELELFCSEVQRQDSRELYGFRTFDELTLFDTLISVAGIGPKSAVGVMTVGSPHEIANAIGRGDIAFFTRVSGIGKKTAERLLLELKDKFASGESGVSVAPADDDVVAALMQLGYAKREAVDAVRNIPTGGSVEERLKRALQCLA